MEQRSFCQKSELNGDVPHHHWSIHIADVVDANTYDPFGSIFSRPSIVSLTPAILISTFDQTWPPHAAFAPHP